MRSAYSDSQRRRYRRVRANISKRIDSLLKLVKPPAKVEAEEEEPTSFAPEEFEALTGPHPDKWDPHHRKSEKANVNALRKELAAPPVGARFAVRGRFEQERMPWPEGRKQGKLWAKKTSAQMQTLEAPQPSTYVDKHVKSVLFSDTTRRAVETSAIEKSRTDAGFKKIPRHREQSARNFLNCLPNPEFKDAPLFCKEPFEYVYEKSTWCCFTTTSGTIHPDAMLTGVLAREALFKPRKPALLEQLKNKAMRVLADYDLTAYSSQHITDIISASVAYVYAGTPSEMEISSIMAHEAYRDQVSKLNSRLKKLGN